MPQDGVEDVYRSSPAADSGEAIPRPGGSLVGALVVLGLLIFCGLAGIGVLLGFLMLFARPS